jgi:hypothetical protein
MLWYDTNGEKKIKEKYEQRLYEYKLAFKSFFEGYKYGDTIVSKPRIDIDIKKLGIHDLQFTKTSTGEDFIITLENSSILVKHKDNPIHKLEVYLSGIMKINAKIVIVDSDLWVK